MSRRYLAAAALLTLASGCTAPVEPPRDPAPLIAALETLPLPPRTLPGPKGRAHLWKADVQVRPRGVDEHAVVLTSRVTLDITPALGSVPVHERGWSGIAMQGLLRSLGDHYIEEILRAGWTGSPDVLSSWQQSTKAWRASTRDYDILANYPPEAANISRLFLTANGSIAVTVCMKPNGMKGTPGPNLQPGDQLTVVIQVLGEVRGFGSGEAD